MYRQAVAVAGHFNVGFIGYNQKEVNHWVNSYIMDSLKKIDRLDVDLRKIKAENEALHESAASLECAPNPVEYEILVKAREQAEAAGEMLIEEARDRGNLIIEEGYKRADLHRSHALVIEGHKVILKKELFNLLESLRSQLNNWDDQPENRAFKEEIAGLIESKSAELMEEHVSGDTAPDISTPEASREQREDGAVGEPTVIDTEGFNEVIDLHKPGALALYDNLTGVQVAALAFLAMITALLLGNLVEGLGILAPLVLIALFVCKELAAGVLNSSKNTSKIILFRTVDRVLYLAILPLLIVFVLAVLYRIVGIIR
jgi:cell division septum initiation protein DivIVA